MKRKKWVNRPFIGGVVIRYQIASLRSHCIVEGAMIADYKSRRFGRGDTDGVA
jgi:hypothetical protein